MFVKQKNTGNVILTEGATGCCPDVAADVCKHVFEIVDLVSVTSITIDGNVHLIGETERGAIALAIEAAFAAEGYVQPVDKENIPGVTIFDDVYLDTQTNILIYTNAETVELTTDPVVTDTYISCIKTVSCRYNAKIPVGAGLSFEISDAEIEAGANPGDSPQTINGDFATGEADALAVEVIAEFENLYANEVNATVKRVRVVELATGFYDVDVWLYGRHPIETNDEDIVFERCECFVDYTIAN